MSEPIRDVETAVRELGALPVLVGATRSLHTYTDDALVTEGVAAELRMTAKVLEETANADIHSHDDMIRSAVALRMRLRALAAAVNAEQARVTELEERLGEYERPADEDPITYTLTAEADGITRRIAPTQALREDTPPIVKAASARYAEELRRTPGKASADGHTGWECGAGASLIVRAETPGPGKLGTHHGVIYACTEHQAAAVERIESAGYGPQVNPAPAGHRWDPWPCGHVTTYNAAALAALSGQRTAVEDPHDGPLHHTYRVGRDLPETGGAK